MCSNRLWRLWDCRQAAEEGPPPRRCRKVSLLGAAAAFAGLLGLAAVSPAAEAPPMRVGSEIAYPPFCSLITYRYDARLRIVEGFQIRPDFYLPEYDVYIEYWGMDTPRYKAGMYLKQDLYMHAGKRLISLYPEDKTRLDDILAPKLAKFGRRENHPASHIKPASP